MEKIRLTQTPENFDRKVAVTRIAQALGEEKKYLGAPSFAYQIGCIKFNTRKAEIEVAEATGEQIVKISLCLNELGCEYELDGNFPEQANVENEQQNNEEVETPQEEISEPQEGAEPAQEANAEVDTVCIQVPNDLDERSWQNLINLTIAKGELISKALGIEDAVIYREDAAISFPWVKDDIRPIRIEAATELVCRMVKMAKEQKRINANEKEVANEKYAFRCFLLRLGFIGKDARIKAIRKELLKNLEGSSAFRQPKEKEDAEQ